MTELCWGVNYLFKYIFYFHFAQNDLKMQIWGNSLFGWSTL